MMKRSVATVAALVGAMLTGVLALPASPVSAATTVDAVPSTEVDALGRSLFDISTNGVYALTGEWASGSPDSRINLLSGATDVLPGGMQKPHLTADGSVIFFITFDALVPGDTNGDLDVYTYTVAGGAYAVVPLVNAPANWTFSLEDISGDGRYLAFAGTSGLFADSGSFIFDRVANTWQQPDALLPDFELGTQRQSSTIRLSSDGRYAAWVTYPLAGGTAEVWVYNRAANTAVRASQRFDGGALTNGSSIEPEISPDGRHVVFTSMASHLVSGVTTTGNRVYVRHLDTAQTVLVSSTPSSDAPYSGPSIGGAGALVMVIENVSSTVNGSPQNAPQPVVYDLAADTRMVLTEPIGGAIPNGYTLQAQMAAGGAPAIFTSTVYNFTTVTPNVPPDELAFRVFETSFTEPLPARLLDTRPAGVTADGLFQGGGLRAAGSVLELDIGGRQTIPADAEAVVLNITAVSSAAGGWITAWPCDADQPSASSLNMAAGKTSANLAISKFSATGTVCLFTSAVTHVLVDALSFFPAGSELAPIVPQRMLDTRPAGETIDDQFEKTGVVPAGGSVTLDLAGRGDIPADAKSVVLNITATSQVGSGYLLAYPCDVGAPNASVSNYQSGVTKASQTIVTLSADGEVCIDSSRQTHLLADAVGYFDAASTYVGLTPARLLDTRTGGETVDGQFEAQGLRPAGSTVELTVSGRGNVPAGDQTVILNIAAIQSPGNGFVTAYPCGQTRPGVSVVNMLAPTTVNNHVVVETGTGGKVCIYVSTGTHMLVDVQGVLPQTVG